MSGPIFMLHCNFVQIGFVQNNLVQIPKLIFYPVESWTLILSYQLKYEHTYVIILSINDLKSSEWTFETVTHEMLL